MTLLPEDDVVAIEMLARVFKMRVDKLPEPVSREIYDFVKENPANRSEDVGCVVAERSDVTTTTTTGSISAEDESDDVIRIVTTPKDERVPIPAIKMQRNLGNAKKRNEEREGGFEKEPARTSDDTIMETLHLASPKEKSLSPPPVAAIVMDRRERDTSSLPPTSMLKVESSAAPRSLLFDYEEACYSRWVALL